MMFTYWRGAASYLEHLHKVSYSDSAWHCCGNVGVVLTVTVTLVQKLYKPWNIEKFKASVDSWIILCIEENKIHHNFQKNFYSKLSHHIVIYN